MIFVTFMNVNDFCWLITINWRIVIELDKVSWSVNTFPFGLMNKFPNCRFEGFFGNNFMGGFFPEVVVFLCVNNKNSTPICPICPICPLLHAVVSDLSTYCCAAVFSSPHFTACTIWHLTQICCSAGNSHHKDSWHMVFVRLEGKSQYEADTSVSNLSYGYNSRWRLDNWRSFHFSREKIESWARYQRQN